MKIEQTMYQALLEQESISPNTIAIHYEGNIITYRRLVRLVNQMADTLFNVLNIRNNDVVLVAQPNIPDTLILIYALNKIGAIVNLVHPFIPFNQIVTIMKKTNTKVSFLFEQRVAKEVDRYREIADKIYVTRIEDYLPWGKRFIYHTFKDRHVRKDLGKYRNEFEGFKYAHELKTTGDDVPINTDWKKTSVLLHSGSTTGDPKTICLSDKNFNYIASHRKELMGHTDEEVRGKPFLSVLPSFHGFGFGVTMHMGIVNGCGTYLVPKFSTKTVAKIFNKVKISVMCGVPTMFESLCKSEKFLKSRHIKDLIVCYCGGDTMSVSLKHRFDNLMKKHGSSAQVFEGYGLTEAVAVNCVNCFDHNKDGSIGYPIKGAEFKIVDDKGNDLGTNITGEIALKSDAVMIGYFKDKKATEATLHDGWVFTGDLGHKDDDGYIFFDQRKKRVVKVSGVGVFPTEIEKLVETVHGVEGCCAIEIPDSKLQAAIKLFVKAKYFDEVGMKKRIMDACKKYLIRWAVPKEIEFIDEIPHTLIGKVDFKKLQQMEDERRGIVREKK